MFSQTTEYALRAMACLAYNPQQLTPTPELARLTRVPPNYLSKVLQMLSAADLIIGRRGVGGGYRLARMPGKISILDVINAVAPVDRISTCPLGLANHGTNLCALHKCLDMAAQSMIQLYSGVTLDQVVSDAAGCSLPLCDPDGILNNKPARLTTGGTISHNHHPRQSPGGN